MSADARVDDPDLKILNSKLGDEKFKQITEQASFLNSQFRARRKRVREKLLQPPTPTRADLDQLDVDVEENLKTKILIQDDFSSRKSDGDVSVIKKFWKKIFLDAIHPQSSGMTLWYFLLALGLLYNAYVIPLRVSFSPYQHQESFSSAAN